MPRFVAAGRRVEDDADAHAPDDFRCAPLVEEKSLAVFEFEFPERGCARSVSRSALKMLRLVSDTAALYQIKPLPNRAFACARREFFRNSSTMNDSKHWTVSKWPFLLGDALLIAVAYFLVQHAPHPIGRWEIVTASACVALGAILGAMPFILDYRAIVKVIEASALGSIAEKIQNLEKLAAQINTATNEWTNAQTQAEKTSAGAKEIADHMAGEVREFSEFMQKMNDSEKAALRLEIEKFRRGEAEWLQVLVRILDHVFVLHAAAVRSGQPKLAEQIANFQNACRDAARRIGLVPFSAELDEPFNTKRHQTVGTEEKPPADAVVAETVGAGFTFQGRLLRPALVRLREGNPSAEPVPVESSPANPPEDENLEEQLPLGSPD
jgi:molecular chaperone GrpE (heat shock protein)